MSTPIRPRMGLAITTVGRPALHRLLESVADSTLLPRVVTVANQSGRDLQLGTSGLPFDVRVVDSTGGASRGRNDAVAAMGSSVDVIGFPNDDSTYPRTCLEQVADVFGAGPGVEGLACSLVESGRPRFVLPDDCALDRYSVWRAIEPAMFLRRETFEDVGGFREDLGTGCRTPWQSGEGTDLLLRVIEQGGVVSSRPDIAVIGQGERRDLDTPSLLAKHRGYARGTGYVYRIHPYPSWVRARILAAPWLRLRRLDPSPRLAARLALARSVGRAEGLAGRTLSARERTWLPTASSAAPVRDPDGGHGSPGGRGPDR
ncbi:Glycosyltransferase, GT2 family [Geodermatophilus obscurus]|uniref:Glycosyltransferase, GT2 family n=1 Tax=Geodermatophilus obscurus TaxID=1861 RepID=A0A1I5EFB9_9ACTN|nr:hypothetical protein [Geodermatophilus obscurus]SFO10165.1 Glycosyltransferase, GT2 family [Geodermatophilus obscurus]